MNQEVFIERCEQIARHKEKVDYGVLYNEAKVNNKAAKKCGCHACRDLAGTAIQKAAVEKNRLERTPIVDEEEIIISRLTNNPTAGVQ